MLEKLYSLMGDGAGIISVIASKFQTIITDLEKAIELCSKKKEEVYKEIQEKQQILDAVEVSIIKAEGIIKNVKAILGE